MAHLEPESEQALRTILEAQYGVVAAYLFGSFLSMHVGTTQVADELRMAAAVKLYELGRLSSGAAARLAGVPRVVFLSRLAAYGVDSFRMSDEQLLAGEEQ